MPKESEFTPQGNPQRESVSGAVGITRRRREPHHLGDRARVDSKPSRRRAMAQPLDLNRVANAPIKLHALHPPPSADPPQRDICCRTFAPALPENPAASVRDYCSGAYTSTTRFYANSTV